MTRFVKIKVIQLTQESFKLCTQTYAHKPMHTNNFSSAGTCLRISTLCTLCILYIVHNWVHNGWHNFELLTCLIFNLLLLADHMTQLWMKRN